MSVAIGRLRHRLTIEQETRIADEGGGAAVEWNPLADVWGAVEALGGKETVTGDRLSGSAEYRIIIRHRSDIGPAMRFRRGDEIFHIASILDRDGSGRFLHCNCERREL